MIRSLRPIFFVCFLGLAIQCSAGKAEKMNLLDFHDKTAATFNRARSIIASGALANIKKVIASVISVFSKKAADGIPPVGPSSNMYKMRWSREMEQIAIGIYDTTFKSVGGDQQITNTSLLSNKPPKGYKHFVWMGPIIDVVKNILSFLPFDLADQLKKFLEIVEIIILVFWMAWCYPKQLPIDPKGSYCAAEALFAARYEVGCFQNLFLGVCVVRDVAEPDGNMFKVGAACYQCPVGSHCEWTRNQDGYYVEGELCIAPDPNPNITMVPGAINPTTTMKPTTDSSMMNPTTPVILFVISLALILKSIVRP